MDKSFIYKQHLFKTSRLVISDVRLLYQAQPDEKVNLLSRTITLLSPKVTKSLPPYFQKILTLENADDLFKQVISESRCFAVHQTELNTIIGFILIYELEEEAAHIGYLLGEDYWGQGYASEFLNALIVWCKENTKISTLFAGVG
ncbi:MAG: GNAT family N-acetyltransferase, partial [Psychromonas sp.]